MMLKKLKEKAEKEAEEAQALKDWQEELDKENAIRTHNADDGKNGP